MKKIIVCLLVISVVVGGALYLKNHKGFALKKAVEYSDGIVRFSQLDEKTRAQYGVIQDIANAMLVQDDVTRRYLVLLQNNLELRPGGGFLGQYAVMEMKNGEVLRYVVEDANLLDKRYTSDREAPEELKRYAGIKKWKFRDANLSPHFPTNVENALHFYGLSGADANFDGVFAINASLLEDLLTLTGPVTVAYTKKDDVTLEAGSALITLEDAIEERFIRAQERKDCEKVVEAQGFTEADKPHRDCDTDAEGKKKKYVTHADKESRKNVLQLLADALIEKLATPKQIPALITLVTQELTRKEVQLWFADDALQTLARDAGWSGEVDAAWDGDYLMVSDANIGALKTDYYMKRSLAYTVDFTGTGQSAEINDANAGRMVRYVTPDVGSQISNGSFQPEALKNGRALATMRMTYENTGTEENYRTSDYHSYTRLYVPQGSTWYVREWFEVPAITEEFGKMVFNYKFDVLLDDDEPDENGRGSSNVIPTMLQYALPQTITEENYRLKIQKQSGIGTIPLTVKVITSDGVEYIKEIDFEKDVVVEFVDGEIKYY